MCPSNHRPSEVTSLTESYVVGSETRTPLVALIRVSGASAEPDVYRLDRGVCSIGSGSQNDVVIDDRAVSRAHVELELVPEGVAVRDLGSRNGTFFGAHRVEKMVLAFGSSLTVGRATVMVEVDRASFDQPTGFSGDRYMGMLGSSASMRHLFGQLERLRGALITVLIEGDSGVGKELVARAIHNGSQVADGPFLALNCGALTRELVSSELFGHQRGAFTGASGARKGAFVAAEGGTLFLDEIGELPLEIQPALLRALEVGEIRAVGSDTPRTVTTRVLAATHRDLSTDVAAGRFRQDLYYRLAVIKLPVPSLSSRVDDIPLLVSHFAAELGAGALPPDVIAELQMRAWPGNVRELRNVVHAYSVLGSLPPAQGEVSLDGSIERFAATPAPYAELKDELVVRFTRAYVGALMARAGGNQTTAAKMAGLDRSYLGRLVAKYADKAD
jgi:two-component system, NtrC family, response regulator GlrR